MLEEMHRSRDDFIALAGHELRTPLTVIQGYAEHLLEDPAATPEQRQQLEIVVRRARSMSDLIDDLFDLAKLDAPLSSVAFAPVPLDEVVLESVVAHRPMAEQHEVTFVRNTEPVHVLGDRGRLRRMCDNVLDNAVKFSPPGGEITVTLRRDDDSAVLEVADQGIGIPPDEVPRVFERLYRATNAIDGRFPGTGLGLSITLATAEAHGGTVTAYSEPGGGAVFTIRLPGHEPVRRVDRPLTRETPPRDTSAGWHALTRVRQRGSCLRLGPARAGRPDRAPAADPHPGAAHRAARRHQHRRRRPRLRPVHPGHPQPVGRARHGALAGHRSARLRGRRGLRGRDVGHRRGAARAALVDRGPGARRGGAHQGARRAVVPDPDPGRSVARRDGRVHPAGPGLPARARRDDGPDRRHRVARRQRDRLPASASSRCDPSRPRRSRARSGCTSAGSAYDGGWCCSGRSGPAHPSPASW